MLQLCWSCVGPHSAPPLLACCTTPRVLVCTPPPHVFEHPDHPDQPVIWQSTGTAQACMLQLCCSRVEPHSAPPPEGCVAIVRALICVPPLQAAVQADHGVQPDSLQSTEHAGDLHVLVSLVGPHGAAPFAGSCKTVRVRDWVPPLPQPEHSDHSDQSDITQPMGHVAL